MAHNKHDDTAWENWEQVQHGVPHIRDEAHHLTDKGPYVDAYVLEWTDTSDPDKPHSAQIQVWLKKGHKIGRLLRGWNKEGKWVDEAYTIVSSPRTKQVSNSIREMSDNC